MALMMCRICLRPDPMVRLSLFEGTIAGRPAAEVLSIVADVPILAGDPFPQVCCSDCWQQLEAAFNLRELVRESGRKLGEMLAGVGADRVVVKQELEDVEEQQQDPIGTGTTWSTIVDNYEITKVEMPNPEYNTQGEMSESDTDSDCPMDVEATAESTFLPEKSKPLYEAAFKKFQEWQARNWIQTVDENCLLAYFAQELKDKRPSTKWSQFSMLRTTINLKMGIDISGFTSLKSLLKRKSDGYCPKKSEILTKEQIFEFLREADDAVHLVTKVALIVGVYGACRREELLKLTLDDIEDLQDSIKITIPNTKTKSMRQFFVTSGTAPGVDMLQLFRAYAGKRAAGTNHARFFVSYRNGKCTKQAIGINTIAKLPKTIAEHLKLPSPELYTGHCFRRSSASLLADSGVDISVLKRLS
ncbi:hypothetical protein quinque_015245 [Culex quinquefasciatus]